MAAHWQATPSQPVTVPVVRAVHGLTLTMHTDASCKGNPGPTGMAVIVHEGDEATQGFGWSGGPGYNNAAELSAVLSALNLAAIRRAQHVVIVTDSDYVHLKSRDWYGKWLDGRLHAIANPQLWNALFRMKHDLELAGVDIDIQCVPAHTGHVLNERADRLARMACKRQGELIEEDYRYSIPLRLSQSA